MCCNFLCPKVKKKLKKKRYILLLDFFVIIMKCGRCTISGYCVLGKGRTGIRLSVRL